MAKRAGRIRCGVCHRVLNGEGVKGLQAHERKSLEGLTSNPREALGVDNASWETATPLAVLTNLQRNERDRRDGPGFIGFYCKACSIAYWPADIFARLRNAIARGEDLVLTASDRS